MPPTTINPDAFLKLKELSAWLFESDEFEEERKNLSRCVDGNRHAKVIPLLRELGFDQIKAGSQKPYTCKF